MDMKLAWLSQELVQSIHELVGMARQFEVLPNSDKHKLAKQCEDKLQTLSGVFEVALGSDSRLPMYVGALSDLAGHMFEMPSSNAQLDAIGLFVQSSQALHDFLSAVQENDFIYSEMSLFANYQIMKTSLGQIASPTNWLAPKVIKQTWAALPRLSEFEMLGGNAAHYVNAYSDQELQQLQANVELHFLHAVRGQDSRSIQALLALCGKRFLDSQAQEIKLSTALLAIILEGLRAGYLVQDVWLKKMLLSALAWFKGAEPPQIDGLILFAWLAWQNKHEHERETATATATVDQTRTLPELEQIAYWSGWQLEKGCDYSNIFMPPLDESMTRNLLTQITQTKNALARHAETTHLGDTEYQQLVQVLKSLCAVLTQSYEGAEPLSYEFDNLINSHELAKNKRLHIELATCLLLLEFIALRTRSRSDGHIGQSFADMARRLKYVREGQHAGAFDPWMLQLAQRYGWDVIAKQLAAEMKRCVTEIESIYYQDGAYALIEPIVQNLIAVAHTLTWIDFAKAAQAILVDLQKSDAAHAANNLATMGLFLDMYGQGASKAHSLFEFDEHKQSLQMVTLLNETINPTMVATPFADASAPVPVPIPPSHDEDIQIAFQQEAEQVFAQAEQVCGLLQHDAGNQELAIVLRRSFHTLKGSARMAGYTSLGEHAWQTEQKLNQWLVDKTPASPELLTHCLSAIEHMRNDLLLQSHASVTPLIAPSQVVASPSLPPISQAPDWLDLPATKHVGDLSMSLTLYNAYLNESDEWSRQLAHALSEWAVDDSQPLPVETLSWAHALCGSSSAVGFTQLAQLARTLERVIEKIMEDHFESPDAADCLARTGDEIRRLLHQFAAGFIKEPDALLTRQLDDLLHQAVQPLLAEPSPVQAPLPQAAIQTSAAMTQETRSVPTMDELSLEEADPALAAIFHEEAETLLSDIGASLRLWLQSTGHADQKVMARTEVMRMLHTLKGGAKLLRVQPLAEQAHQLESAIESYSDTPSPDQARDLLAQYDGMQLAPTVPKLQHDGLATLGMAALSDAASHPVPAALHAPWSQMQPVPASAKVASTELIRVKLALIDKMVNQSGEVLIARSRMESEIKRSQLALADMSAQLAKLRDQLRELELQTELQVQTKHSMLQEQASPFDSLEFDRFTRTQELTRFMAESISDLTILQRGLQRSLNVTEDDLAAQSRQTKELQRHLLRTRMVEFDSVAERLHRLARVTSQEMAKPTDLTISGGRLEMDRSVLERVVPAFEHLIRNAIVHGIESQQERLSQGKPAAGRIHIELSQTGNDVTIVVSDDGRGLDEAAVRSKAAQMGASLSQSDPSQLIFIPGLSTAPEVTELAGRGIGMDVIRNLVIALGGRVEVSSKAKVGVSFQMILPLTTAVTQIVLVRTGTRLTGIPSSLVQTILRIKPEQMQAAYTSGELIHQDRSYACYPLAELIQDTTHATLPEQPYAVMHNVMLLQSANQLLAIAVDEVVANQEVVIKNLGAQLSQMPGLTGVTVLASGAPVLIYNPVALRAVYAPSKTSLDASKPIAMASPAQAPPLMPLILTVDDSITMRRVLQRLLQREGYRVVQAADGKQALDMLHQEKPALVLSDVEMPQMDGFELLKQIRSSERLQDIPVVMITSRMADKHRDHAKSLGANAYLGKPYPEDELLALIERYAGKVLAFA